MSVTRADEIVALGQPPDGYVVDFEHPQRRADIQTYWCFGVGNFLALIFLAQRFYTKLHVVKSFQLDDGMFLNLSVSDITQTVVANKDTGSLYSTCMGKTCLTHTAALRNATDTDRRLVLLAHRTGNSATLHLYVYFLTALLVSLSVSNSI